MTTCIRTSIYIYNFIRFNHFLSDKQQVDINPVFTLANDLYDFESESEVDDVSNSK